MKNLEIRLNNIYARYNNGKIEICLVKDNIMYNKIYNYIEDGFTIAGEYIRKDFISLHYKTFLNKETYLQLGYFDKNNFIMYIPHYKNLNKKEIKTFNNVLKIVNKIIKEK